MTAELISKLKHAAHDRCKAMKPAGYPNGVEELFEHRAAVLIEAQTKRLDEQSVRIGQLISAIIEHKREITAQATAQDTEIGPADIGLWATLEVLETYQRLHDHDHGADLKLGPLTPIEQPGADPLRVLAGIVESQREHIEALVGQKMEQPSEYLQELRTDASPLIANTLDRPAREADIGDELVRQRIYDGEKDRAALDEAMTQAHAQIVALETVDLLQELNATTKAILRAVARPSEVAG